MAHIFPLQISLQAQGFIVGSTFYYSLVDAAVGQYFRETPESYRKIRSLFAEQGISDETWEINWSCFERYLNVFQNPVIQNALYAMPIHWDWYIRKIGGFLEFARNHVLSPILDHEAQRRLQRIDRLPMADQIRLLADASGLDLGITVATIDSLSEMYLVRNLGLHNQWEIDATYLARSNNKAGRIGDIRSITVDELLEWRDSLTTVIRQSSTLFAEKYSLAPDYPL